MSSCRNPARGHSVAERGAAGTAFFVGDVGLDEYFTVERWPGVADKAGMEASASYVGGMIANAAAVHAGLGGATEFISLLNTGALTERMCHDLGAHGVGTSHMLHDETVPDPLNLIFLVGGEHVVLYAETGQAPMLLGPGTMEALKSPGYLYTTLARAKRLSDGARAGADVLAALRSHGRRAIFDLDVDGFSMRDSELLRDAEVVIMNKIGFGHSFGGQDADGVNEWILSHGVRAVVRTLSAEGAEIYDGSTVQHVPGHQVPVVDVTGAGDTFGGALVHALSEGEALRDAVAFAVAAASRAVTIQGPRGGVASRSMIEEYHAGLLSGTPGSTGRP